MRTTAAALAVAALSLLLCASPLPAWAQAAPEHPHHGAKADAAPGPSSLAQLAKGALLLPDLGPLHRPVTTTSKEAQAYFDQGLKLTFGFNHDEAARSFARAAQLDPQCASCFWGAALVLGPNYNVPMLPDRAKAAWEGVQRARALAPRATPVERALIGALEKRYPGPDPVSPAEMQPYNVAYARAMEQVAAQFPDDVDVQVLTAEAQMNLRPWKLWTLEGDPEPGTEAIVARLEKVLAKDPQHPGANHYYIHVVEASRSPERAVPSAERLAALMPGAGHVVHMSAHIFQRVGRYADASEANRRAVKVDDTYIAQAKPSGYYPMYLAHNHGFLAFASSMQGRSQETLKAARAAAKSMPPDMVKMMPGMDFFVSLPLYAMVRFGQYDALLKEPRPPAKYPVMTGLWLHGHGLALAAKGRLPEARKNAAELKQLAACVPADMPAGNNTARDVLGVASLVLEAGIAERARAPDALERWASAVQAADKIAYSEPNDWFYPVRHFQGAALLDAKRFEEAEAVYREDLRRNPHNGWGLFGLAQALKGQGKTEEAAKVQAQFQEAWAQADIPLTRTALWGTRAAQAQPSPAGSR
jgi:tetratricopeptide (TPR) repeat protein